VSSGSPYTAARVSEELARLGTPERARASARYFKTGPGGYGEGDVFVGVPVPQQRRLARQFRDLPLPEVVRLLASPVHEARLTALLVLVDQFSRADEAGRRARYRCYLDHTSRVNGWDLVDSSAPGIVGGWLENRRDRSVLRRLAGSDSLWERRIAVIATLRFVGRGDATDALAVSQLLVDDGHDLVHKAVGWVLREVGDRCSRELEEAFLRAYCRTMPRAMLRAAVEHLPPELRRAYLDGTPPGRQ
jgi:3-methyladenine DNA glycosylase AlkD